MYSTRKIKFNFSENEKVLCYEPDPKKAKVLYESKVLECCVGKDSNGRKSAQYLVHFYGWNSSWDRIVKECDIVKDNPQNRSLQRSLAEKAAIALKGKKLKLNKIPAIIKEIVVSSANTAKDGLQLTQSQDNSVSDVTADALSCDIEEDLEDEGPDQQSDTSSDGLDDYHSLMSCRTSISNDGNDCNTMSESNTYEDSETQTLIYSLTVELKAILDKDYTRCVTDKSLYELPIEPNVFQMIDEFALNANFVLIPNPNPMPTPTPANTEPNECQILSEFKSSLEIYFNALIENNYLFYNDDEKEQFRQFQLFSDQPLEPIKVYGFVHLLRLLVSMSDFLLSTPGMTKKQLKIIVRLIQHFIDYLSRKRDQFI